MISTLVLIIITILQLSFLVTPDYFEAIADKLTIFLLTALLYCKGGFGKNYIKCFILMLMVFFGLLFLNKSLNTDIKQDQRGQLWVANNQVEIIGENVTMDNV